MLRHISGSFCFAFCLLVAMFAGGCSGEKLTKITGTVTRHIAVNAALKREVPALAPLLEGRTWNGLTRYVAGYDIRPLVEKPDLGLPSDPESAGNNPAARAAYERRTGLVMQPLVVVEGEYSASLDGLTLGGDRLVEIKVPFKGRDSTLWKTVEAGRLPEHYQWQVQHQLLVTKAEVADVFVFEPQPLHVVLKT